MVADPAWADGASNQVFVGDSEMAALMRAHDWASTPLGPPEAWPQALKVALRLLLTSRFEMWLGWGPDVAFFYNDAYRPTLGLKHPQSLGMPTQELWPEIWDEIEPRIRTVYEEGKATWDRALPLVLHRNGYPEESYHTFSYSPLMGDTGEVEGLFCAVSEETERVISERRLGSLRELAAGLAAVDTREAVFKVIEERVGANLHDFPFTLTYLFDADDTARLACSTGIVRGHAGAPETLRSTDRGIWPIARILAGDTNVLIEIKGQVADLPTGAWDKPPMTSVLIPLARQGADKPAGFMVAGLNPYRRIDADYLGFLSLIAGQVTASLSNAEAYEAERQRASALAEAVQLRHEAAESLQLVNQGLAAEVKQRTAERDRLRSLFQQAPGFMCLLIGPDLVFDLMNEAYLQLVGHRDLIGKPLREALPEIAGQGFFEILDKVYREGEPFVGHSLRVMVQRMPDAPLEERFVDLVYQPIFGDDGRPIGIFAEGSDVTDRVNAETELKLLNEELEARVKERTNELAETLDTLRSEAAEREMAQEALRQAQKMEAVGQLTGGIAHDFNNLLTGIVGSLDMLRNRIAQGRLDLAERYVTAATTSANRAAALTHRLLAFARRQPLDPKPVQANALVASLEDLFRRTLGETISLEIVLAGGLWPTLCDPNQLESALLNLVINARDAMPEGGNLTIETANAHLDDAYVAAQRDVEPGQYVAICVTDTGTGMTPEVIARAFDPFFTTKPIGQGTGLGLSMIYGFVKQSEGHVRIYSEVGEGTTVKLYLPRHRGIDQIAIETAAPVAAPRAEMGETVLVVEDEPVVRSLIIDVLTDLGYSTLEAHDGPAGLQFLQSKRRIDLLVTDVGLPGINGRQLADQARERRPDLKVLFMTGYAENAVIASGFLEPGMAMMTKPFAVDALAQKIRGMIEQGS